MNNNKINQIVNIISIVLILALIVGGLAYISQGFSEWDLFNYFNIDSNIDEPIVQTGEEEEIQEEEEEITYDDLDYWVNYVYWSPFDSDDIMMYYDDAYLDHMREMSGDMSIIPFMNCDYDVDGDDFIFYEYIDFSGETDYTNTQTEFKDNTYPNLDFNNIDSVMIEAEGILDNDLFIYDIDTSSYVYESDSFGSNFNPEYKIIISNKDVDGEVLNQKLLISYKVNFLNWEEKDYIIRAKIRIIWSE